MGFQRRLTTLKGQAVKVREASWSGRDDLPSVLGRTFAPTGPESYGVPAFAVFGLRLIG